MTFAILTLLLVSSPGSSGAMVPVAETASEQVSLGKLQASHPQVRNFMTQSDYPSHAARHRIEGTVELLVLVGPSGRIAYTSVVGPADFTLAAAVQSAAARRIRRLQFDGQEGKYVWVRLPTVQFRLGDCGGASAMVPPLPDAIVVTFYCHVPKVQPPIY